MVQGPGGDAQSGGIGEAESKVGASDRPKAGFGRSIDVGGPTATCGRRDAEDSAAGDIGDEVLELVD